jgi:hypothetical protein
MFCMNFRIFFLVLQNNGIEILIGIPLNVQIALGGVNIFE